VTLAGVDDGAPELNHRIELAPEAEHVLHERRFHYDVIVGESTAIERVAELLLQTQPQAIRIHSDDLVVGRGEPDPCELLEAAASTGLTPPPLGFRP
jgi:hypothetical protein